MMDVSIANEMHASTKLQPKARDTAQQFEAVFIGQMARLMLESVEQDSAFSGGHGEDMFRGVLAEKLGEEIAKGRGIGLADQVMAEIIRLQQAQPPRQTGEVQ